MDTHNTPPNAFDIRFAIGVCRACHKYREQVHKRLVNGEGTIYLKAVCEHFIRLMRFGEGVVAFSTTGVQSETAWLNRPALEMFASQCALQFGTPKLDQKSKTKADRALRFYAHIDFTKRELLERHIEWEGNRLDFESRKTLMAELGKKLKEGGWSFGRSETWYGDEMRAALKDGVMRASELMSDLKIADMSPHFDTMIDVMHLGIHATSFSGSHLHNSIEPGLMELVDDRRIVDRPERDFGLLLASFSLQMLAYEFGEATEVAEMINNLIDRAGSDDRRYVTYFPTAVAHLP